MFTIYLSKSDSTLQVDWDKMPEVSKNHIIEYGLRQKLNDAGSSATAKALGQDEAGKQAFAMAEVVLSALMEGKTRTRTAAESMTLEEREFAKIVKALAKKLGLDAEADVTALAKKLGKDEEVITLAIQAKAEKAAEVARQIKALKQDLPEIEI